MQKLKQRKVALQRTTAILEKDKSKWKECLVPEVMSSEDSEDDGSFTVRPLPWRSEKANSFLSSLDCKHGKKQSKKSKIMTLCRENRSPSDRSKPIDGSIPAWVFKP